MARILIVNDNKDECRGLGVLLRGDGHVLTEAGCAREAVAAVGAAPLDLVITAQNLSKGEGLDVLSACREADPMLPVIILTEVATLELALAALRRGAFDVITTPFTLEGVRAIIARAVERIGLRRENRLLRGEVDRLASASEVVATSAAMQSWRTSA